MRRQGKNYDFFNMSLFSNAVLLQTDQPQSKTPPPERKVVGMFENSEHYFLNFFFLHNKERISFKVFRKL